MTDLKFTPPTEFPTASPYAPGMMLRDWFAGQALANAYTNHDTDPNKIAEWAYHVADAMLAERNK